MQKQFRLVCSVILLGYALAACSTAQTNPTATIATITPAASTAGDFPLGCRPDSILLDNLKTQLPYPQVEIVYQSYGGEQTLLVWFVDPALLGGDTAENRLAAADSAAVAAQTLMDASVCVGKFGSLFITVVDADYTAWFSGAIQTQDVQDIPQTGAGGGPQEQRGGGVFAETATPPELPGGGACDWKTAREALAQTADSLGLPAVFWYVRDDNGNNVFMYWSIPAGSNAVDSLDYLEPFTGPLACLYPQPSGISVMVSAEEGPVLLTGYLPGASAAGVTTFNLNDLRYQELSSND